MENDGHANGNQKKAQMVIFVMDKIDFKSKTIIRDKEELYTNKRANSPGR